MDHFLLYFLSEKALEIPKKADLLAVGHQENSYCIKIPVLDNAFLCLFSSSTKLNVTSFLSRSIIA